MRAQECLSLNLRCSLNDILRWRVGDNIMRVIERFTDFNQSIQKLVWKDQFSWGNNHARVLELAKNAFCEKKLMNFSLV